jgi:hypothetical protein
VHGLAAPLQHLNIAGVNSFILKVIVTQDGSGDRSDQSQNMEDFLIMNASPWAGAEAASLCVV